MENMKNAEEIIADIFSEASGDGGINQDILGNLIRLHKEGNFKKASVKKAIEEVKVR